MGPLLLPLVLLAYFAGIFLAVVSTVQRSGRLRTASLVALAVTWALHLMAIVQHGRAIGTFPLTNGTEFLIVLGWAILTLYLFVSIRWNVAATGLILPPLAALMVLPALWLPSRQAAAPYPGKQYLFVLHTSAATAGTAALCVAFAMSLFYLVQDRALKSKRAPTVLRRLPSLSTCDRVGHLAVLVGFPLLTLGILTGGMWSLDTYGRVFEWGPKQVFPLLAWIVYAMVIYARIVRGAGGRQSAYLTIAGFTLCILTVFGMAF